PGARASRDDRGTGPRLAPVRRHAGRSARASPGGAGKCQRDHRAVVRSLADEPRRGAMMATSRESERALRLAGGRPGVVGAGRAMVEQGLEPDCPPAALTEAGALSGDEHLRDGTEFDLRALLWCSIDNDDSRDLDQLTVADTPMDGCTTVRVAVADVSASVE